MSAKIIANLWERLTHIYGHKFSSVYGESAIDGGSMTEAAKTWASGLRGLTGEQIANGLRECINCGESWPPTLPDFVKMCKGNRVNGFGLDYTPECYRRETRPERIIESDTLKANRKEWAKSGIAAAKEKLAEK